MNKDLLKIIILLLFITVTIAGGFFAALNLDRYYVSAPMQDLEYKKSVLRKSGNYFYNLESLRPLVGEEELTKFIIENDKHPEIYTPSEENIRRGIFRANLHMHTTNSDGSSTVEYLLNQAQRYAKTHKIDYMYVAITDHNTVLGAKEVIKVLQKNRGRYKNLKIVTGLEIFTAFNGSKYTGRPFEIHVLTWCINPYDKFLNKEFYKKNLSDRYNRRFPDRDFDWVIATMSQHGIVGIAHPARYTVYMKDKKYPYIKEMLNRYSKLSNKVLFTEGYYQSYTVLPEKHQLGEEYNKFLKFINDEAEKLNIIRTGSTDTHGNSIFRK